MDRRWEAADFFQIGRTLVGGFCAVNKKKKKKKRRESAGILTSSPRRCFVEAADQLRRPKGRCLLKKVSMVVATCRKRYVPKYRGSCSAPRSIDSVRVTNQRVIVKQFYIPNSNNWCYCEMIQCCGSSHVEWCLCLWTTHRMYHTTLNTEDVFKKWWFETSNWSPSDVQGFPGFADD